MPLFIYREGSTTEFEELVYDAEFDPDVLDIVNKRYRDVSKVFTDFPCQEITSRVLYVNQEEVAVIKHSDLSFDFIGSDDATSCFIVVLRDPETGQICLSHFNASDYFSIEERFRQILYTISEHNNEFCTQTGFENTLDLFVVGACNCTGDQEELAFDFLDYLCKVDTFKLQLRLACIGDMNTVKRNGVNFPLCYGVAMNIRSGLLYPARLPNKGPDMPLRCFYSIYAMELHRGHHRLHNVYDPNQELLRIGPFEYSAGFCTERAHEIEQLSDDDILQNFSTSPHCEPSHFVSGIREMWSFLSAEPSQAVFPSGLPRVYRIDHDHHSTWCKV